MSESSNITRKSTTRDMTTGNIALQLITFSLPLLAGNLFQLLYNTVDTLVVGNFLGTEALAAVGSTTVIVNMLVFFFNGVSIGAGVVISRYFGAHDYEMLHKSIETTMALTALFSIVLTAFGVLAVHPMLRFMSTPDNVMDEASLYLRIYFAGISGLLVYNMGSGILRAVGDTTRPLLFLIFSSVLNIALDLFFVIVLKLGIAGVALATILAQFISAFLIFVLLTSTADVYRFSFKDLVLDREIALNILSIGMPTGVQAILTSFSNVFVQAYINAFGSGCMAGWGCYSKLDQFVFLPVQSMSAASTTFVSQNLGARNEERAKRGTRSALTITFFVTGIISLLLFRFASFAVGVFSTDSEVLFYGTTFIHYNVLFLVLNGISHTLAGALRGRGDSKSQMYIMLFSFVLLRQIYLFCISRILPGNEIAIGLGYPVGWTMCFLIDVTYYYIRWGRKKSSTAAA